jgi:hypothetical protein
MSGKVVLQHGMENSEWPRPVGEAFIRLCLLAHEHGFDLICAVGFNIEHSKAGHHMLCTMLSPSASTNPHQAEMLDDVADLFKRSADRIKQ